MDQLVKSTTAVMHKMVLIHDRIINLEEANHTLSKRQREKKTRICQEGSLTVREATELLDGREAGGQLSKEMHTITGRVVPAERKERRCGNCGNPGHNVRTCQEDVELSSESDSS
jgi:hypothetical protein